MSVDSRFKPHERRPGMRPAFSSPNWLRSEPEYPISARQGGILWLSDLHYDGDRRFGDWIGDLADARSHEAVLVTGDIASYPHLQKALDLLATGFGCPIYFTLGNHDYYGGSTEEVLCVVRAAERRNHLLRWIDRFTEGVPLFPGIALIGQGGWAHAEPWIFPRDQGPPLTHLLVDYKYYKPNKLRHTIRRLAQSGSALLKAKINNALSARSHVVALTHFPPFSRSLADVASRKGGLIQAPAFESWVNGAGKTKKDSLTLLCGHLHRPTNVQLATGVIARTCIASGSSDLLKGTVLRVGDFGALEKVGTLLGRRFQPGIF